VTTTEWIFPATESPLCHQIVTEFGIHPVIAKILVARGLQTISDVHEYLYGKLPNLYDPDLFPDMDAAVQRIIAAIDRKEAILIYGDNDVDGMSAAALLTEFFSSLGGIVFFNVPERTALKKSLLGGALGFATERSCKLLITVDCGITAAKEIADVVAKGIDVIVTDHHEPTSKIPHCLATLNPKLLNSTYPNRDLTGVGVAFKLAHAVANAWMEEGRFLEHHIDMKHYLDLVAMGTIADMAPLRGENRILVRYGLKEIASKHRIGLEQLIDIAQVDPLRITPTDIASKVAPRLNSLGRIADPIKGVELLLCKDKTKAAELVQELDINNLERQRIEKSALQHVEELLLKSPSILEHKAIVLASEKWHPGIIAILSARIAKQYNRPTLVISLEQGIGKGSLRTIPEFPLLPLLRSTEEWLINYGGHDYAAGLTIHENNIDTFRQAFYKAADKSLKDLDLIAKIYLDASITFPEITFDFMEALSLLEPIGHDNPPPLFFTDVNQVWMPKQVGRHHLKLFLEQKERMLEGIAFNLAPKIHLLQQKGVKLRIAFTPYVNTFHSKTSLQLQIKDFKVIT
jgi:single-stranded-DNA-specific exonuclease